MKVLSIDYGTKYLGLAVSDELEIIATTLPHLVAKGKNPKFEGIMTLIATIQPRVVVLGLPQKGEIHDEVQEFGTRIEQNANVEVVYWNEDYTSKQAEKGKSIKFKKEKSHSEAARIILQEYLDSEMHKRPTLG